MKKKFRLAAKNLHLIYPNTRLHPKAVLAQLHEILFNRKTKKRNYIQKYCISQKLAEDGTPSLHVYLGLLYKLDVRNERFFDLKKNWWASARLLCNGKK